MAEDFFPYAQEQMGFDQPVMIIFQSDSENAENMLGKTAFYDPEEMAVTLFTDNRHPKDVMRSLSHELVHHTQNCRGDFDRELDISPGYAQRDDHLRGMEREAYERGNLVFRDWEDMYKQRAMNEMKDINKIVREEIQDLLAELMMEPSQGMLGFPLQGKSAEDATRGRLKIHPRYVIDAATLPLGLGAGAAAEIGMAAAPRIYQAATEPATEFERPENKEFKDMAQKDIDIAKAMGALRLYSDADQQDIMRGIGQTISGRVERVDESVIKQYIIEETKHVMENLDGIVEGVLGSLYKLGRRAAGRSGAKFWDEGVDVADAVQDANKLRALRKVAKRNPGGPEAKLYNQANALRRLRRAGAAVPEREMDRGIAAATKLNRQAGDALDIGAKIEPQILPRSLGDAMAYAAMTSAEIEALNQAAKYARGEGPLDPQSSGPVIPGGLFTGPMSVWQQGVKPAIDRYGAAREEAAGERIGVADPEGAATSLETQERAQQRTHERTLDTQTGDPLQEVGMPLDPELEQLPIETPEPETDDTEEMVPVEEHELKFENIRDLQDQIFEEKFSKLVKSFTKK